MEINIFEIVEELNKELNRLSEAKDIVKKWACEADNSNVYITMTKLCKLFDISVGWRYDE